MFSIALKAITFVRLLHCYLATFPTDLKDLTISFYGDVRFSLNKSGTLTTIRKLSIEIFKNAIFFLKILFKNHKEKNHQKKI